MPEQAPLALDTPATTAPPAVVAPPSPKRFELPADAPEKPAAAPAAPAEAVKPDGQTDAGEAPAKPQGDEKPPPTDQDDPEKKRQSRRFERRLDKAYRREAEARARADLAEKRLAELAPKAIADPSAPRLEDFKDIEDYAAAREKHATEKVLKEHTARQQQAALHQYQAKIAESWEAKAERGSSAYDDFEEVVGELKPDSPMTFAIMEADNGDDIAHYLGKHLKEAERIASLSPASQIREIGKLEAKLAAEPKKPKAPSTAPAPITPLEGKTKVVSDVPSEQDDIGAWIRKRQKQVYGKNR